MQFWPVSKNFKISDKKISKELENTDNFQPSNMDIEVKSQKSNDDKVKEKRPITGASSNVNKYEIDFNDYNNFSNSKNKHTTLTHLYEHNSNYEYNSSGKKEILPLLSQDKSKKHINRNTPGLGHTDYSAETPAYFNSE